MEIIDPQQLYFFRNRTPVPKEFDGKRTLMLVRVAVYSNPYVACLSAEAAHFFLRTRKLSDSFDIVRVVELSDADFFDVSKKHVLLLSGLDDIRHFNSGTSGSDFSKLIRRIEYPGNGTIGSQ